MVRIENARDLWNVYLFLSVAGSELHLPVTAYGYDRIMHQALAVVFGKLSRRKMFLRRRGRRGRRILKIGK